jgi:hypothetical protein
LYFHSNIAPCTKELMLHSMQYARSLPHSFNMASGKRGCQKSFFLPPPFKYAPSGQRRAISFEKVRSWVRARSPREYSSESLPHSFNMASGRRDAEELHHPLLQIRAFWATTRDFLRASAFMGSREVTTQISARESASILQYVSFALYRAVVDPPTVYHHIAFTNRICSLFLHQPYIHLFSPTV